MTEQDMIWTVVLGPVTGCLVVLLVLGLAGLLASGLRVFGLAGAEMDKSRALLREIEQDRELERISRLGR